LEIQTLIKKSEYHDSVTLMLVARELTGQPGVKDAAVLMGTDANKSLLKQSGLLNPDAEHATPNDLIIAVLIEKSAPDILVLAEKLLSAKPGTTAGTESKPKTIRVALKNHPEINLAIISTAGRYATRETWNALRRGLHVLLFSDNVSMEDEKALKEYALSQGLLVMGPGAGTAIINGVGLGFANAVPKGNIGIVSAAGTGLQEVSTLLAKQGQGISQAIGTGGRDLSQAIGGLMFLAGMDALDDDPETGTIVLISKPPHPETAAKVLARARLIKKPVVACFLGIEKKEKLPDHVLLASTLEEAAFYAAVIAGGITGKYPDFLKEQQTQNQKVMLSAAAELQPEQRFIRGLFSGGTLCYEAQVIWQQEFGLTVFSNAPVDKKKQLKESTISVGNSIIDLGEEEFTVGRPHPMIDNDLRIRRLFQEVADPEVAVILLDVVIGYGAHPDPATELAQAIIDARQKFHISGRNIVFISSVTGTEADPQKLSKTEKNLKAAGVIVCPSNAAAARLSAMVVNPK
jgi:FdrA protein